MVGMVTRTLLPRFLSREQHRLYAVGFGRVARRFLPERKARDDRRTHPLESRVLEQREHLSLRESAADSAGPELGVVDDRLGERLGADDVGDRKPAPGAQHAEQLADHAALAKRQVITPLEMTTSMAWSGTGMSSIRPSRNSTLVSPAARAWAWASARISGFRSTPLTLPAGPTCHAAMMLSSPAPLPRSSTTSPGCKRLRRCGLPTPANDATAPPGARSSQSAA